MFEYMTAQEVAEKWEVSLRWVQRQSGMAHTKRNC